MYDNKISFCWRKYSHWCLMLKVLIQEWHISSEKCMVVSSPVWGLGSEASDAGLLLGFFKDKGDEETEQERHFKGKPWEWRGACLPEQPSAWADSSPSPASCPPFPYCKNTLPGNTSLTFPLLVNLVISKTGALTTVAIYCMGPKIRWLDCQCVVSTRHGDVTKISHLLLTINLFSVVVMD